MNNDEGAKHVGPPPGVHLYTRDGFVGSMCVVVRPHMVNGYSAVAGPHAPQRLLLSDIEAEDESDPQALPTEFGIGRDDVVLSVSRRRAATPYAFRNVECDELHFIQEGEFDYLTDFGVLTATPGDFIGIARTVTYRVIPRDGPSLRVIMETPEVISLAPPAPFGMINFGRDVTRPAAPANQADKVNELWLKAYDGVTRYIVPHDPLALKAIVDGIAPVWKLNLASIAPMTYSTGGPPASFAQTASTNLMFYTLSARPPAGRPPQHHNADYDEIIFFFRGPGGYGALREPGAMAWVPKGVTHQGPDENVPEGYLAWLVETRGTMRLTAPGLRAAQPMETTDLGVHPDL